MIYLFVWKKNDGWIQTDTHTHTYTHTHTQNQFNKQPSEKNTPFTPPQQQNFYVSNLSTHTSTTHKHTHYISVVKRI